MQLVTRMKRLVLALGILGGLGHPAVAHAQWIDSLSSEIRSCILWSADHEEGNLNDWHFGNDFETTGGVLYTGGPGEVEAVSSDTVAHSGQYAAKTTITQAVRAENGNRAVRLMRWADAPWGAGGQFFPAEAYYSAWMYFPRAYNPNKKAPWDPGDGGWWNVFQFKAFDEINNETFESLPMWSLNVEFNEDASQMEFYLVSQENTPSSYTQAKPKPVPVRRWVHVEVFYRYSSRASGGTVVVWQDGQLIFNIQGVKTALEADYGPVWGVGNYTNHISGGEAEGAATIYFDDAVVGRRRTRSTASVPACLPDIMPETLPPLLPAVDTLSQTPSTAK